MSRTINLEKQLEGTPDLKDLLEMKGVRLKDVSKNYNVYLVYDMSEDTTANAVFKLEITGNGLKKPVEIYLYKEEITRVLRAV